MGKEFNINKRAIYFFTMLIFALTNVLLLYNPDQYLLPLLVLPLFLVGIYTKYGLLNTFYMILGGLFPYMVSFNPGLIPVVALPYILLAMAFIYLSKRSKSVNFNMAFTSLVVAIGIFIRQYFIIYIIGKVNILDYAEAMTNTIRGQIYSYVLSNSSRMGLSQLITLQSIIKDITRDKILLVLPGYLAIISVSLAYISLRILKSYLRFSPYGAPKVSYISEIKANPIILSLLLSATAFGSYKPLSEMASGPYIMSFTNGVMTFIAIVVFFASVLHVVVTKFNIKNNIGKLFFTLPSIFLFGTNAMILYTIVDSVMDFREITDYGLMARMRAYNQKDEVDKS